MSRTLSNLLLSVALSTSAIALTACGGGGGGSTATPVAVVPPPPPPPPTSSAPTFTAGTFEPASSFKDQCQVPRSGVDSEGNAFTDTAGTTTIENFWLRSWTDETYLWNTEVVDQDPAGFTDRLAYFNQLRTTATTASGEDKDDFHFSEPTTEFLERRNSAASSGYGVRFAAIETAPPRDFRVLYTEPGSPASAVVGGNVNFPRGAQILSVDGADLVNGNDIDTLNAGLFPAVAGESHTFRIREALTGTERDITIVSEDIAPNPVNRMKTIDTPSGKVGYLLFNTFGPFSSEEQLADAFTSLKAEGINDLVLDLRYNGGGLLAVASQLGYMIAGDSNTDGKRFELLQFNAGAGNVNPVTGQTISDIPFYKTGLGFTVPDGTALDTVDLPRVFILSTSGTCSASEAVINGLRGADVEVILIGDTTCGKPYGFYPTDNCGETFYTIQFRGINNKDFGDYSDGFVPQNSSFAFGEKVAGCVVPDDLDRELGDESEGLLSAALTYRADGTCPAVTTTKTSPIVSNKYRGLDGLKISAQSDMDEFLANNRDMRLPGGVQ